MREGSVYQKEKEDKLLVNEISKSKELEPDEKFDQAYDSVENSKENDQNLDNDTIKLLKTQDLGYIIHKKVTVFNQIYV